MRLKVSFCLGLNVLINEHVDVAPRAGSTTTQVYQKHKRFSALKTSTNFQMLQMFYLFYESSTKSESDNGLTHWDRVTHICVNKLTIIGSDNGLSPGRHQAIIWTNAEILLIGPVGTKLSEILIEIHTFSFKKMHLKMSSGKWWPFCPGLNVLTNRTLKISFVVHVEGFPVVGRGTHITNNNAPLTELSIRPVVDKNATVNLTITVCTTDAYQITIEHEN